MTAPDMDKIEEQNLKTHYRIRRLIAKALDHGYTRNQLSAMCDVSLSTLLRWEQPETVTQQYPEVVDRMVKGCKLAIRKGKPGTGIPDRRRGRSYMASPRRGHPWRKGIKAQ